MVAYTAAFLAAANLLALAHAAPAQPVCFAVTTVITGSPIWVPRADPTTSAGWGAWPSSVTTTSVRTTGKPSTIGGTTWTTTTSSGGAFYPVSSSTWTTSSTTPLTTITITPTFSTTDVVTPTPSTTTPAPAPPAPTCPATDITNFSSSPDGSCECEFAVTRNMHAPYTASTSFWERTDGEIIGSLEECQQICNDNSACTAAIWVNRDGAPSNEYLRCWQTSGLPAATDDGYGQLSYKGSCSGTCSQNYTK